MASIKLFQPDSALSYPHFNTYRLSDLPPTASLRTHALPSQHVATASRIPASRQLAFKEIQSRVGWDHAAGGLSPNEICYIDEAYKIVTVSIGVSRTI
jgi:hypothetical protein